MMLKTRGLQVVRCALVGDGLVGKTSLVRRFVHHVPTHSYVATVFENIAGQVALDGNKHTVSIFDTAGQQDYEGLRVFTYAQSDVILVCFSVVDRESFRNVTDFWLPEIRAFVGKERPVVLVATQTDLRSADAPSVSRQEGINLSNKLGAKLYIETSANDSWSVNTLFETVVASALKHKKCKSRFLEKLLRR